MCVCMHISMQQGPEQLPIFWPHVANRTLVSEAINMPQNEPLY